MENKIKNMFLTLMESIVRAAQHLESVTKTLRCLRVFFSCDLVYFLERGHMGTFCTATVYSVEKTFTLFNASKVLFKTVLSRIVGRK